MTHHARKSSARERALYIRALPLIVDSVNRNGGVMRRSDVAALYSDGAIQHAIEAKVVDAVTIRYTDPMNIKPMEHILCLCTTAWDRKTKPSWLGKQI